MRRLLLVLVLGVTPAGCGGEPLTCWDVSHSGSYLTCSINWECSDGSTGRLYQLHADTAACEDADGRLVAPLRIVDSGYLGCGDEWDSAYRTMRINHICFNQAVDPNN